jgi:hypothetical protein
MATAKCILKGFDALGNDHRVCRSHGLGLSVRKKALEGEPKIHIPPDMGMER